MLNEHEICWENSDVGTFVILISPDVNINYYVKLFAVASIIANINFG